METSLFIAKIMGPLLIIVSISSILNAQYYIKMVENFIESPALIYIAGLLAILTGLVLINTHNIWIADWPVIITIFGWLAFFGGIFRVALPKQVKTLGSTMIERKSLLLIIITINLALGCYLTLVGYKFII